MLPRVRGFSFTRPRDGCGSLAGLAVAFGSSPSAKSGSIVRSAARIARSSPARGLDPQRL
jgi:hypothetical protein